MHIFIVNLKKDIAKKEHMQKLCRRYGLEAEFIDAIDGGTLLEEEVDTVYSNKAAIKTIGRKLSRGELGCALSHRSIYQRMINENIEEALILEDDIEFDIQLIELLERTESFPNDWQIVLLGHHSCAGREVDTLTSLWGKSKPIDRFSLARSAEMACGTYGYLLRLDGAKILLEELRQVYKPIDHFTGLDRKLHQYVVVPPIIKIDALLGNNSQNMHERSKLQREAYGNDSETAEKSSRRRILEYFRLYGALQRVLEAKKGFMAAARKPRKYSE